MTHQQCQNFVRELVADALFTLCLLFVLVQFSSGWPTEHFQGAHDAQACWYEHDTDGSVSKYCGWESKAPKGAFDFSPYEN